MRRAATRNLSPAGERRLRTPIPFFVSTSPMPSDEGRAPSDSLAAEERAVCDALASSLTRRAWNDPDTRAALAAYARRARDLGVEPGPLVIAVKRLIREQAIPRASEWLIDVVTSRAVLWSI